MSPKGREPWPAHVKAEALAIAAADSFVAAERATGVPAATVRSWARRTGQGVEVVLPTDGRGVAVSWADRQSLLLDAASQLMTGLGGFSRSST